MTTANATMSRTDKTARPFGDGIIPARKPRKPRTATVKPEPTTAEPTTPASEPTAKARKPRTPKPPVPDTTALFVVIKAVVYRCNRLRVQDPAVVKAFRLRRADGKATHDVHVDEHGAHCTCGDHTWRHEGADDLGCKHIRSLRVWGLLPPAPETAADRDGNGGF